MAKKKTNIDEGFEIKVEEDILPTHEEKVVEELNFYFDKNDNIEPVPRKLEDYDKEHKDIQVKETTASKEKRKSKIERRPTSEQNISARYKNGIFQSYDVELYIGDETVYDERKSQYVRKKKRIKKSFKAFENAKMWRNEQKREWDKRKRQTKDPELKKWKMEEVVKEYIASIEKDVEYNKKNKDDNGKTNGYTDSYLQDAKRYANRTAEFFCAANHNTEVAKIDTGDIEEYLKHLKREHNYSKQTLIKNRTFISNLWNYMIKKRSRYFVFENVAHGATIPAGDSSYKARILDYHQIEELILEACKLEEPFFLYLVVFSITQALRRGELCGLQWGDIDWEKRRILIRHSRIQIGGRDDESDPKGGRLRAIELHKLGYDTILLYKKWQEDYLKRPVRDDEYVLKTTVNLKYGYEPHTGKVSRKWKEICDSINKKRLKAGKEIIPYGRIHDGRHVYATLLLTGVEKDEKEVVEENGKKEERNIIIPSASYIQVYQSMGHSLPKAFQNTTTKDYTSQSSARFEITAFWNKLINVSIKEEWDKQVKCREEEWNKLTQLQKDKKLLAKESRLEKAHREHLKGKPPKEAEVNYTEDGPLPSFEEKDL